jgi:hypothetical protein
MHTFGGGPTKKAKKNVHFLDSVMSCHKEVVYSLAILKNCHEIIVSWLLMWSAKEVLYTLAASI